MLHVLPRAHHATLTQRLVRVVRALALGAGVGALTLGLGGRLAMAGFAELTGRGSAWTFTGTLSVIASGGIAGAVAALLFLTVAGRLLPRAPTLPRGLAVGALTLLLAAPGIRPPLPLTFALFAPAFLAFGVLLVWSWGHGGSRGQDAPAARRPR